jgi:hypothetical protein
MRKALHVGTPVLTTDQTPQAAHSALEGLFITQPNEADELIAIFVTMSKNVKKRGATQI